MAIQILHRSIPVALQGNPFSILGSAMGCTNTKLKAEEEPIPEKIRPLLYRQVLSQKGFLKKDTGDDERSDSLREKVVKPCPNPEEIESRKQEIVVRVTVEKFSKVIPLPDSAFQTSEDYGSSDQGAEEFKDAEDMVKDAETEEFKDAEEEDDDSDDPSKLCPGSPSFRIYCQAQPQKNEEKSEDPHKCRRSLVVHHKSLSTDSIQCAASRNSSEIVESSTKRKHKLRKLRAVKSLLKVKSCYYPSCTCGGDPDTNRIVAAKQVQ